MRDSPLAKVFVDQAAKSAGEPAFYILDVDENGLLGCDEEHDASAIKRGGEWRLYFEAREDAETAIGF